MDIMFIEPPGKSELFLNNTLTRKKEQFISREPGKVKMFTCGPSIYGRPHVGNYRTFLFEDVLLRYLEYLDYSVERVINFTDVEDKAVAAAQKKGVHLEELTNSVAEQFFREAALLRMKLPAYVPRSSTTIEQAAQVIKILIEKGYAYWYGPDVFFDPLRFAGFGKLFGLDMSRWPKKKRRFHRDTYPGQRWNLGDFILWHGHRTKGPDQYYWDTEIGKGRPAWNVQDPAIIAKHLGCQIDISAGGIDNLYRHHDYTIAVMEAASGREFSHYWVHCQHVLVNGAKMSKSKGNVLYPEHFLNQGYKPEHLRFFLILPHYRERLNLTEQAVQEGRGKLDSFVRKVAFLAERNEDMPLEGSTAAALINDLEKKFRLYMNDDINVRAAFDSISDVISQLADMKQDNRLSIKESHQVKRELDAINSVLQIW